METPHLSLRTQSYGPATSRWTRPIPAVLKREIELSMVSPELLHPRLRSHAQRVLGSPLNADFKAEHELSVASPELRVMTHILEEPMVKEAGQ